MKNEECRKPDLSLYEIDRLSCKLKISLDNCYQINHSYKN